VQLAVLSIAVNAAVVSGQLEDLFGDLLLHFTQGSTEFVSGTAFILTGRSVARWTVRLHNLGEDRRSQQDKQQPSRTGGTNEPWTMETKMKIF
jgi:hypothetical protein